MNILEEIQNCTVEWKELGEVVEFYRGNGLQKKDFVDEGNPVIHYGQIYTKYNFSTKTTVSFTDDGVFCKLRKAKPNDIIMATTSENIEDVGKSIVWEGNEEIGISGDSYVLTTNQNSRYINYYFRTIQFQKQKERKVTGTKVIRIHSKDMEKFLIPIPPLEIQEKIVQILDKMTEYVTELTSELTSRKKQYSFYRDKLLSFENEVYKVEWKMLSDCLKKGKGTKITASQMKLLHKDGAPIRIFAGGKTYADVNYGDIPDKDIHTEEAIVVKSRGIIDFEYCTKPFSFKNEFWSYSSDNENINLRYIYHYLVHNKGHFQNIANNMQMPQISSNDTEKFKIPVPSLEIQSRIVQVLDNFDTVCNDLNIGLPKEIELRQKQYEYFREKLLTFVAEGEYTDSTVQTRHH